VTNSIGMRLAVIPPGPFRPSGPRSCSSPRLQRACNPPLAHGQRDGPRAGIPQASPLPHSAVAIGRHSGGGVMCETRVLIAS
jgi:hypothetical protein